MITVICPTVLFISNNDWCDVTTKNKFLDALYTTFECISNNKYQLYWNEDLENLLWEAPSLMPWYSPETYRILNYLKECAVLVNDSCKYNPCTVTPHVITNITGKDIISPVLPLLHYILANDYEFSFVVDETNNKSFQMSCDCHKITYTPIIKCVNNMEDTEPFDITNEWDVITTNEDSMNEALKKVVKRYFNDVRILYKLRFSSKFLSEISQIKASSRNGLLYAIAKRIIMHQKDASNSKSLNDETLKGFANKRSFRVNHECRIQYTYTEKGCIELLTYSSEGEHDKKLSHTRR